MCPEALAKCEDLMVIEVRVSVVIVVIIVKKRWNHISICSGKNNSKRCCSGSADNDCCTCGCINSSVSNRTMRQVLLFLLLALLLPTLYPIRILTYL